MAGIVHGMTPRAMYQAVLGRFRNEYGVRFKEVGVEREMPTRVTFIDAAED
jgi:hypothetical protein